MARGSISPEQIAGNTGDATKFLSETGWAVPGSGGSTAPRWDDPPASPSTWDDEFNAGSLNAKWTLDVNSVASVLYGSGYPSCIALKSTASSQNYAIHQTFAPAGDFSVWVRFGAGGLSTNFAFCGMFIGDNPDWGLNTAGSNMWEVGLQFNNGIWFTAHKRVAGTTSFNVINSARGAPNGCMIWIQRVGGVWSYIISGTDFPGEGGYLSNNMGFAPTVNYLGLVFTSDLQPGGLFPAFDFIRVNQFIRP